MTAKQKANQARFKKVVAEAKKLRKKNPKLTQAQAVKQAWAIMYSKKKVSGYSEERNKIHKNATSWIKRYQKRNDDDYATAVKKGYDQAAFGPAPKVGAVKKKAAKKKSSNYHKDTKSHNVNIRVISGTESNMYKIRDQYENDIKSYLYTIDSLKKLYKTTLTKSEKNKVAKALKSYKNLFMVTKRLLNEQNKLINKALK